MLYEHISKSRKNLHEINPITSFPLLTCYSTPLFSLSPVLLMTSLLLATPSAEECTPKRPSAPSTPKTLKTTVEISKHFMKKLGHAADQVELSNNVLVSVIATMTSHGGGDIQYISLLSFISNIFERSNLVSEYAKECRQEDLDHCHRSHEQTHLVIVYKIPYRRARAWPSGCIGQVRL